LTGAAVKSTGQYYQQLIFGFWSERYIRHIIQILTGAEVNTEKFCPEVM